MFVVMLPTVLVVSGAASFQARYPFYQMAPGEPLAPFFWQWEFFYFLQFFSLEFFFRGFMVHGLKHRFGYYTVFVMCVPYCMIHFHKPLPEALAAIIAGVILGTLSLKSRSILLGVAIHYSVAITMDLAALWRKGLL
jgi:membrane protease YdiL (CAAX protease family)